MAYVWSLVLLGAGLVLLAVLALRVFSHVRRFRVQQRAVLTGMNERVGLLRARVAALRVAVTQRRRG